MNKAILASINSQWCEQISNGNKTIEVRKTIPKIKLPFKCYIYCTKRRPFLLNFASKFSSTIHKSDIDIYNSDKLCNGKIIGEFVCDKIYRYSTTSLDTNEISSRDMELQSCLTNKELSDYEHSSNSGDSCLSLVGLYGWHISELKIYDTPVSISSLNGWKETRFGVANYPITTPPQSWIYAQEMKIN